MTATITRRAAQAVATAIAAALIVTLAPAAPADAAAPLKIAGVHLREGTNASGSGKSDANGKARGNGYLSAGDVIRVRFDRKAWIAGNDKPYLPVHRGSDGRQVGGVWCNRQFTSSDLQAYARCRLSANGRVLTLKVVKAQGWVAGLRYPLYVKTMSGVVTATDHRVGVGYRTWDKLI